MLFFRCDEVRYQGENRANYCMQWVVAKERNKIQDRVKFWTLASFTNRSIDETKDKQKPFLTNKPRAWLFVSFVRINDYQTVKQNNINNVGGKTMRSFRLSSLLDNKAEIIFLIIHLI